MDNLVVKCPDFRNNEKMPGVFTCDGKGIFPSLEIGGLPKFAKSLVLIVDDPDAPGGNFVHYVAWNIPSQNTIDGEVLGVRGRNSSGKIGWISPCPPHGPHRYFFRVFALNSELGLGEGSEKGEVERQMQGHVIAKGELVGKYSRQ
ncbi:MAG: YbhB/YbcL family Raf kinase inhibitor-like protein [archaeon]|nr:YbhB/YbcL family Raf kinase inhibitor-like protein [archaeon]